MNRGSSFPRPLVLLVVIVVIMLERFAFVTKWGPDTSTLRTLILDDSVAAVPNTEQSNSSTAPSPLVSFAWDSLPPKSGHGVIFCAYSKDTNVSLPLFFEEAATSASMLKAKNPSIQTAMITNAPRKDVPAVFDKVVTVADSMLFSGESSRNDGVFRQWFSRIYYLAHSPFETTWYFDSHAHFLTTEMEGAFEEFESGDIDFAVANQIPQSFHCHNFAMLYKWNDRVRALFVDWLLRQLESGVSKDDQGTLCQALKSAGKQYDLVYGAISPQWSLALLSLNWGPERTWWRHRTTGVITGKAHVCHSNWGNSCEMAAKTQEDPRILYLDSKDPVQTFRSFYSPADCKSAGLLPYEHPLKVFHSTSAVATRKLVP